MPPLELVLQTAWDLVLPVAAVTAVLFLVLSLSLGKPWAAVLAAPAVVAGLVTGNILRGALPWLPGNVPWHWLFILSVVAGLLGAASAWPGLPRGVSVLLSLSLGLVVTFLLHPAETRPENLWTLASLPLVIVANWLLLDFASERAPGGIMPLAVGLACMHGALVLVTANIARFADYLVMLGAGFLGLAVVAFGLRVEARGAMSLAAFLLPTLMLLGKQGTFNEALPTAAFALVGCAPLLLSLTLIPPLPSWRGRGLAWLCAGLLLLPIVVAVVLALRAAPSEEW